MSEDTITVGQLRAALGGIPDDTPVWTEYDNKYTIASVMSVAIGTTTVENAYVGSIVKRGVFFDWYGDDAFEGRLLWSKDYENHTD